MEKAKVYFTDFRTPYGGDTMPGKLKKLIRKAGIAQLNLDGQFVAIKIHFGELGNVSYLRPNYARAVVDVVKELGGKPFLTDCNTLYPGSRKNALEHLYCAWENGFTPLTVGCPILIGDGLKGTDDIEVPVRGGEYVKNGQDRPGGDGCGRDHQPDPLQGPRDHRLRRSAEESGHGLRLPGGQEGTAQQRQGLCTAGNLPGLPPLSCGSAPTTVWYSTRRPARCTWTRTHCVGCGRCVGACNFDAIDFEDPNCQPDAELPHRRVRQGGGGRAAPASIFRW